MASGPSEAPERGQPTPIEKLQPLEALNFSGLAEYRVPKEQQAGGTN
jgi:hypothetical protein